MSLLTPPMNLLQPAGLPQVSPKQEDDQPPAGSRAFGDVSATRKAIYDKVFEAASGLAPVAGPLHTLQLSDVQWADPDHYTKKQRKEAVLAGGTIGRRLRGTWQLVDNASGQVVDQRQQVIARVPHLTDSGTFVYRGTEYALKHQQRLRPGLYTRRKANGELEAHANVLSGGPSHRYFLDPAKGVFYVNIGQAKIPALPLLQAAGATPQELREAWGDDIYAANYGAAGAQHLAKLKQKLLGPDGISANAEDLKQAVEKMKFDPEVTRRTLGEPFENLSSKALLSVTRKLLQISRGEAEPDNRDDLTYQSFMGPEDILAERIAKDRAGVRRQLLFKMSNKGNLQSMPSSALQKQIDSALIESGLGMCFDPATKVLLRRGFVAWPDVRDDDEFACRIEGRLVYARATKIHRIAYDGELLGCRTRAVSYLVTPNHRLWCRTAKPGSQFREERADSAFGRGRVFETSLPVLDNPDESDFLLPAVVNDRHGHTIDATTINGDVWAEFLGWYISEGWAFAELATPDRSNTCFRVTIAQHPGINSENCREIARVLTAMPFRWRFTRSNNTFVVNSKQLVTELLKYGSRAHEKQIPRYCFNWSARRLRLLARAYLLGDGNVYKGYTKAETVSPQLSDDLIELFGRTGYTGRSSLRKLSKKNPNWRDSYVVSQGLRTTTAVSSDAQNAWADMPSSYYKKRFRGVVYCASVPGEMLYVLRDGKPHWSLNSVEETNPLEIFDKQTQLTRLGEGGVGSSDAFPDEARDVQASHVGYLDLVRTPENLSAGIELYLSRGARKTPDGKLVTKFKNPRTGRDVWKTPQQLGDLSIAFPGASASHSARVPALVNGRVSYVTPDKIDLELPNFEGTFSGLANLVPLKSMTKGQRVAMGSRMATQALPLVGAEAPLVQTAIPGTGGAKSYEEEFGSVMGAVRADKPGIVLDASADEIKVRYADGKTATIELDNMLPYNRRTFLHQTPVLQPGQRFQPGELLAKSNYTDDQGTTAMGLNAKIAFVPWGGSNFEDAVVISESFAKRMKSDHAYQHQLEPGDRTRTGKKPYVSLFPTKYDRSTLSKLDNDGVIKPGESVEHGQPLILAAEQREHAQNKVHRKRQAPFMDKSVTWEHDDPGVVTDVVKTDHGPVVVVRSSQPMRTGDKLSGRHGNKGVVVVKPDAQMPYDSKTGEPYEVALNPLGVISRGNPSQVVEASLGKLAAHLGRPIKIDDFSSDVEDRSAWAREQLRKNGLSDLEDVVDPETGRKIKSINTGMLWLMKLQHQAEHKGQARSGGGYTSEGQPARGSQPGGKSKRLGLMDVNSLLSSGATETLRDARLIRGQQNDDYWLQFMSGYKPREPQVPMVYQKFVNQLKAAGVNVVKDGAQTNIMAMTDKDVDELAKDREITSGDTVRFDKDLAEIDGGLFDKKMTGGHHGKNWSGIRLTEPMLNPAMEEPARRLLGLTQKKFEDVVAGKEHLDQFGTGPAAIAGALKNINVDAAMVTARAQIKFGTKTGRDQAVRKLGYLKNAKRLDVHPGDWVLSRVPVLPPQFRPVSVMSDKGIPLVADANYLYRELIEANNNLRTMQERVGAGNVGDEQLALYNAFKAVTGLGDPVSQKSKEMKLRGLLGDIFGSSPKFGTVARKLISATVDNVGRGVVTPDPDLDMDSVGIPEDKAFDVYQRFIIRRLRRSGMPMIQALQNVKDKSAVARKMLVEEMEQRPVIVNRAPVLHRYGIMAFKPHLVKDHTLHVSPLVVGGFGMDFDGDAVNYQVPASEESRQEAIDRLLPSRQLLSPSDFSTPVHMPGQEYVGGLYEATREPDAKKTPRVFASKKDAIRAYRRGDLGINDPVKIMS